jgi:ATPase family AAA domain-containing protein 3A/B
MESLKKQEEAVLRQEKIRRETAAYEADLKSKADIAKAKAEADGRIKQERANHDLALEKLKIKAKVRRGSS